MLVDTISRLSWIAAVAEIVARQFIFGVIRMLDFPDILTINEMFYCLFSGTAAEREVYREYTRGYNNSDCDSD